MTRKRVSIEKTNYEMMIGGRLRKIPQIKLTESLADPNKYIIQNSEFTRIRGLVCHEICHSSQLILCEEIDFLIHYFASILKMNTSSITETLKREFNIDQETLFDIKQGIISKELSDQIKQYFQKLNKSIF